MKTMCCRRCIQV